MIPGMLVERGDGENEVRCLSEGRLSNEYVALTGWLADCFLSRVSWAGAGWISGTYMSKNSRRALQLFAATMSRAKNRSSVALTDEGLSSMDPARCIWLLLGPPRSRLQTARRSVFYTCYLRSSTNLRRYSYEGRDAYRYMPSFQNMGIKAIKPCHPRRFFYAVYWPS